MQQYVCRQGVFMKMMPRSALNCLAEKSRSPQLLGSGGQGGREQELRESVPTHGPRGLPSVPPATAGGF